MSEGSANTIWTCSGIPEQGLREGGGGTHRGRGPLTVADIGYTDPSGNEEVAEEARGRWWERMARCVLTSSLGAPSCEERRRKVAALLLLRCRGPYRCSRSVADAAPLQQPAAPRPRRLPSRAMTTVFHETSADRNWTPHDPVCRPSSIVSLARNSASGTLKCTRDRGARM